MAYVGRCLRHTAEESRDQRCECFREQDISRAVIVACQTGAFRIIYAADDCQNAEGDGDGQILDAPWQCFEKVDRKRG